MCYMTFCHVSFCHSLKFYLVVVSVFLFPYLRAFVRLLFTKLCWYWYSYTTLIQETKTPNGIPYLLMNLPYYLGTLIPRYLTYFIKNYNITLS